MEPRRIRAPRGLDGVGATSSEHSRGKRELQSASTATACRRSAITVVGPWAARSLRCHGCDAGVC